MTTPPPDYPVDGYPVDGYPVPGYSVPAPSGPPEPTPAEASDETMGDLRVAAILVLGLAVLGALLGFAWSAWSGPQQRAFVLGPGKLYPYDEVETMAGADGRYMILVGVVGLIAGFAAWFALPARRGPLVLLALGAGGLAGAALTAWVGHLSGGGTFSGATNTTIAHLPLSLHMRGLMFVEGALAVLVYGLFIAFAARDDLGRPDPVRGRVSVQSGGHPQDGGGDRDAAGLLEQGEFPAQ
jgi:hypothetical protein